MGEIDRAFYFGYICVKFFSSYLGWGHHFVSKTNYHLIIPVADHELNTPLVEDFLHPQTHILHGLIHSNGFGHLLYINGIAAGSKYIGDKELMDLWDRICTNLGTR